MKEEKHKQLESMIKQKVDIIIRSELSDPRFQLMSIIDLKVSKELDFADVYVSHHGDDATRKSIVEALNKASGFIEKHLGRAIRIRRVPKLRFKLDDSMIHAAKMEELFKTMRNEGENQEPEDDPDKKDE